MLFTFAKTAYISRALTVRMSSSSIKVTLVGAAGGIGQPLGLLLKKNTSIAHLAFYDLVGTPGVAADLSHINTPSKVTEHLGPEQLAAALEGADVVIIPAGVPRKPGITRGDLFLTNAGIVRDVAFSKTCPKACHSTFPSACKVYKNNGCFNSGVPLVSKRAYCSSSSERERERRERDRIESIMRAMVFEGMDSFFGSLVAVFVLTCLAISAAILLCTISWAEPIRTDSDRGGIVHHRLDFGRGGPHPQQ
uniref:Malate dehydrogenase, mitochondrial n=1 Tax=Globodera rostochiensis TaxID=31243 RepID=A0A914HVR1_GLORO